MNLPSQSEIIKEFKVGSYANILLIATALFITGMLFSYIREDIWTDQGIHFAPFSIFVVALVGTINLILLFLIIRINKTRIIITKTGIVDIGICKTRNINFTDLKSYRVKKYFPAELNSQTYLFFYNKDRKELYRISDYHDAYDLLYDYAEKNCDKLDSLLEPWRIIPGCRKRK